ncbi:uncharacterized protein LOC130715550 [Lotus japonicus]|uniref:uncharacterized protein LOC130715550 n=1 Tax=Lotus japonicus TaxID=34305 RepID=UPI002588EAF4|nr:uncharacterized protein LOC130715550 [Lotus japonicus]
MALLFRRLRNIIPLSNPTASLSLLHHRLSSTSNSGAGDHPNTNHPFLCSLRNPSLPLLHHHYRLFSSDDPNSNHPFPSLLRELREAVKSLSVSESPFISNFHSILPPLPFPAIETTPFLPSKKADQDVLLNPTSSTFSIDDKLQRLKASVLTLKQKQETNFQRLSELFESKSASGQETLEITGEILTSRGRRETIWTKPSVNEIDVLITKMTRDNEKTVEIMELAEKLTNSTLTSLYQIFQNLNEIRKDLQDDEVWNELKEGLVRVQEMELKNFKLLAEDSNLQLDFFRQRITDLFMMRDNQKG